MCNERLTTVGSMGKITTRDHAPMDNRILSQTERTHIHEIPRAFDGDSPRARTMNAFITMTKQIEKKKKKTNTTTTKTCTTTTTTEVTSGCFAPTFEPRERNSVYTRTPNNMCPLFFIVSYYSQNVMSLAHNAQHIFGAITTTTTTITTIVTKDVDVVETVTKTITTTDDPRPSSCSRTTPTSCHEEYLMPMCNTVSTRKRRKAVV